MEIETLRCLGDNGSAAINSEAAASLFASYRPSHVA